MIVLRKYFKGDPVIWIISFLLLIISIPAVYSASALISLKSGDMHFLVRQLFGVITAAIVIYLSSRIPYKKYISLIKIIFPIALFLLILTLVSGSSVNNAKRWIALPGTGIMLQTSEIAKLALIMFVAKNLAIKSDNETYEKNVKKATWGSVIAIGLIFPADLSSALLISLIITIIYFAAAVKIKIIYKILLIAFGLMIMYILAAEVFELPGRFSTWQHRIETFIGNKNAVSSDDTYQADVSKMAIVNGGFFGKGPGNGTLRYLLPQSHSDFIFAFITEEYGLNLAVFIIILYLILFYRGIRAANKTKSLFAIYLVLGFSLMIIFQAFINIGVSVGALPVTGQTLPLISMGRTSLLVTSFAVGVMLNVNKSQNFETNSETDEK
ncbi:MAG: FtsW/RodA/SpoVE family cell cycle protein [Bacteroidales bacterium]|nr:FtsW/RodA/SpoVE family cell cycle protein [Bacteroidales bacterium]